jgi:hypothetical protein
MMTRENQSIRRNIYSSAILSTTQSTWTALVLQRDICGDKPATECFIYSTDQMNQVLREIYDASISSEASICMMRLVWTNTYIIFNA